jgi:hypothetical protein
MLTAQFGATYLVRPTYVEIVSQEMAQPEAWIAGNRQLVPQVHADFQNTNLEEALRTLAIESGISVILDRNAYEAVGAPSVTANFDSAPLDTAVELLANMCGMKAIALDRVIYVTSVLKAQELQEERAQRSRVQEKAEEKPQPSEKKSEKGDQREKIGEGRPEAGKARAQKRKGMKHN